MASRLPAGSAGPSDRTSGRLTQTATPTSVAGARSLAVNGRTGGDVKLLQAGASTRQPRVAAPLRLANGSMSRAEDRLAAISSWHATGTVALTQRVAVDEAGFLSVVVCNCPGMSPLPVHSCWIRERGISHGHLRTNFRVSTHNQPSQFTTTCKPHARQWVTDPVAPATPPPGAQAPAPPPPDTGPSPRWPAPSAPASRGCG